MDETQVPDDLPEGKSQLFLRRTQFLEHTFSFLPHFRVAVGAVLKYFTVQLKLVKPQYFQRYMRCIIRAQRCWTGSSSEAFSQPFILLLDISLSFVETHTPLTVAKVISP